MKSSRIFEIAIVLVALAHLQTFTKTLVVTNKGANDFTHLLTQPSIFSSPVERVRALKQLVPYMIAQLYQDLIVQTRGFFFTLNAVQETGLKNLYAFAMQVQKQLGKPVPIVESASQYAIGYILTINPATMPRGGDTAFTWYFDRFNRVYKSTIDQITKSGKTTQFPQSISLAELESWANKSSVTEPYL